MAQSQNLFLPVKLQFLLVLVWGLAVAPVAAQDLGALESIDGDRSGVIVYGGNRDTGLEVVKSLVKRGENVAVMVRPSSDAAHLEQLGVTVIRGDAMNAADAVAAARSRPFRAAVSTLGGRGDAASRPDFIGNKNAIDAAKAAGIQYFVLVTVIGTGDSYAATPWFSKRVLKDVLVLKNQAERYLIDSGLKYTIVRPGGLLNRPAEGKSVLTEDASKFSWMIRADLGELTAGTLYNERHVGKIYTAFDPTRPTFLSGLLDRFSE